MELTAWLARQLLDLDDGSDELGLALGELATGLATAVPSLLTVSLVLVHQGVPVPVTVTAEPHPEAAVLASLAVELAGEAGSMLILRAAEPGAFLLLQAELAGASSGWTPEPQVDQHLSPTGPPEPALTAARADLAGGVRTSTTASVRFLAAGLEGPVRIHDLRHAHASWLLAGGADLQVVKERLGHANIATTERYLHTLPDADDTALDALDRVRGRSRRPGSA